MRTTREAMAASHEMIVETGARLFREKGIDATSVVDVMQASGMTHGGFYRHFDSKTALVNEALAAAFDEMLESASRLLAGIDTSQAVAAFARHFLSDEHVSDPAMGCPTAALGGEVARQAPEVRATFNRGTERLIDLLAPGMPGDPDEQRKATARLISMLVGAVVLARAGGGEKSTFFLAACRSAIPGVEG